MNGPVEIVPRVYGLGSEIVNWYLVEDGGRLTAVDSGLPAFKDDLERDLRAIGRSLADVEAVILTHSDSDHTGMAPAMREAGARVLVHTDDDRTLRKPGPKSGDASPIHALPHMWRPAFWRFFGYMARRGGAHPEGIEGAETFEGGAVLDVPGTPAALHTPGHTPGSCSFHFEGHGALFVGDALYTWNPIDGSRVPQVGPSFFNVSNESCFVSLDAIEPLEADVLLPGHGEPWREGPAAAVAGAREVAGR